VARLLALCCATTAGRAIERGVGSGATSTRGNIDALADGAGCGIAGATAARSGIPGVTVARTGGRAVVIVMGFDGRFIVRLRGARTSWRRQGSPR
jgi:hypothetical protein